MVFLLSGAALCLQWQTLAPGAAEGAWRPDYPAFWRRFAALFVYGEITRTRCAGALARGIFSADWTGNATAAVTASVVVWALS